MYNYTSHILQISKTVVRQLMKFSAPGEADACSMFSSAAFCYPCMLSCDE
jgi:hypothetical protein